MMNKKLCFLSLFLLGLFFVSCEETKEPSKYDNWEARNDAFIDSLQQVFDARTDPELLYVQDSRNKSQKIFYKKIKSVAEGQSPYYTSKVSAFYRGMFINEEVFGITPKQKYYTRLYKQLDVFDGNFKSDDPSENDSPTNFAVSEVVSGWIEVLQHMKPGERWEVYIPWRSAYGSSSNGAIPACSNLIFDITLLEIIEP